MAQLEEAEEEEEAGLRKDAVLVLKCCRRSKVFEKSAGFFMDMTDRVDITHMMFFRQTASMMMMITMVMMMIMMKVMMMLMTMLMIPKQTN